MQVADLLGNGTACLVWNSHLPADARRPVRYVDLMAQGKPHLLIGSTTTSAPPTEIEYTPSTRFYVAGQARRPAVDHAPAVPGALREPGHGAAIAGAAPRSASTYSYHHGYFDGVEREFRGFGRVEQVDVESYGTFAGGNADSPYVTDDLTLYQPPVKTVTWFHTGAALDRGGS